MGVLAVIAIFAVCGLFIVCVAWLAGWMLEPINRAGGNLRATTRFMLTDFIGLMLLLQAALAIPGRAIDSGPMSDHSPYWILLTIALVLAVILWTASVSVVSRAGITRLTRRLTVIVLLVPGTLAVIVTLPISVGLAITGFSEPSPWKVGLGLGGCLLLAALSLSVRLLSFWALVGSPGEAMLAAPKLHGTGGLPS